jgi:D-alanine--poly(phosphoribitol) ligase subunit 1
MNCNIAAPFFESALKYPEKLALFADAKSYSYREVLDSVCRVASWLTAEGAAPKKVGIIGSRSMGACVGILGAAGVGAAYVPISLKQPEYGVIGLLKRSGLDAVIADASGSAMLTAPVLEQAPAKVLCIGEAQAQAASAMRAGRSWFDDLPDTSEKQEPVLMGADDVAYILYTSGSTGVPKGVMLPAGAVMELLEVMERAYPVTHEDRFAETTDISFDLSVYNMFATWRAGASLHVIPAAQAMAPAKFVTQHQITVWLSVPAIAAFMSRMGLLKPGIFPTLRYTFFAGEPLLTKVAKAWQSAVPNSAVVNMYGPTEATVICIGQEYTEEGPFTRDCVATGKPFPNMRAAIAQNEMEFAERGTPGELLLGGLQLALGYLDDPEKTASRFVSIDGARWYRT